MIETRLQDKLKSGLEVENFQKMGLSICLLIQIIYLEIMLNT